MTRLVRLPDSDTYVQPSNVESVAPDAVIGQVRLVMASGDVWVVRGTAAGIVSLLRGRK